MSLYGEDERRDSRYMDDDEYRRMRKAEDDAYEYHGDAADDEDEKETAIDVCDGYPEIIDHTDDRERQTVKIYNFLIYF